jgi:dimethylargininase
LKYALVRPPGASFVDAISSRRLPIDAMLAQAQHAEYCQALAAAGVTVEVLSPDERYPDSCFMQDPAVVIREQAIICRMGAPSRRGEEEAVAEALSGLFPARQPRGTSLARIVAPGTLEGGDVLVLPDKVLVGLTARTNQAGIAQLIVALSGLTPLLPVYSIPIKETLHLLSAVTYIGRGTLIAVEAYAGHPLFAGLDIIVAPPEEAYAVNALGLGESVVVPAGYPHVAALLHARGFNVLPVSVSEFAKADGGVTCLSFVWEEADK